MDPIDAALAQQVGQTIAGRWTLRRLIGAGGMAAVYAAETADGATAAVKLLYPEMARRRDIRERFLREASVMARIIHPGMVSIYEQGQTADQAYLVMELLNGETVADRVRRIGRLAPNEVLAILDQVLDVLSLAHSMGVVHRDLKPENLFLTQDGRVKVLDFGLARLLDSADESFRTRTGAALGTLPYMAPEQALGRRDEVDARTDLFAVGATAFRLLTGRRIHEAPSEAELLMCMASQPAPPLAKAAPDLPAELGSVVDRALAFAKSRRYPDARTMQGDVRALLSGNPPPFAQACWDREEFPTKPHGRVAVIDATAPLATDSTRPLAATAPKPSPQTSIERPALPATSPQTQPDHAATTPQRQPLPATVVMPASIRDATVTDPPVASGATIPTAPISDAALQRRRQGRLRTAVLLLMPMLVAVVAGLFWLLTRNGAKADDTVTPLPSSLTTTTSGAPGGPSRSDNDRLPLRHPARPISPIDEPEMERPISPAFPPKRRGAHPSTAATPRTEPTADATHDPTRTGRVNLTPTSPPDSVVGGVDNQPPLTAPAAVANAMQNLKLPTAVAALPTAVPTTAASATSGASKPPNAGKKAKRRGTTRH